MSFTSSESRYIGPKAAIALATLATPFFLGQYAPQHLLTRSPFTTALLLLSLEAVSYLVYTIIYPNYLSPLRYLPTPPVSLTHSKNLPPHHFSHSLFLIHDTAFPATLLVTSH
jgi:hypothetical protein